MVKMRNNNMLRMSCLFCFLFCIFLIWSQQAIADDIYVDDSGNADYTNIQDAINAANVSDTIHVASGTYNENIIINKSLILSGAGSETTSIIGSDTNQNTIKIMESNIVISGFYIENSAGKNNHYHCIFIQNADFCTLSDNIIEKGENGIYFLTANSNIIHGNTIKNNNQKGIRLSSADENTIYQNSIQSNGDGIYCTNSDSNEIYENNILNNGYGIYLASSNDNVLYNNDFDDNYASNAYDSTINTWSYNNQGNFWDDYNDYDDNEDGIGDSPYEIDSDSIDNYPLGDFLSYDQIPVATIVSISPNPATPDDEIFFNGHVTDDGTIVEWEWKSTINGVFGNSEDCSSSSLSLGTHTIRFRVKDDNDQWSTYDEETLIINVESDPGNTKPTATIVAVNPTVSEEGDDVFFQGYGSDDGSISRYQWRSSIDSIIGSESSFTISSLKAGVHMIYFKVQDDEGVWSNEDSKEITINEKSTPVTSSLVSITGGPYTGKVNASSLFDASESNDPTSELTSYAWDFGDGSKGKGKIITHSYNQTGNYTITLTVTNQKGQTDVNTTYIIISSEPVSDVITGESPVKNDSVDTPGFSLILLLISLMVFTRCKLTKIRKK